MKIVITGAGGFIGSKLAHLIHETPHVGDHPVEAVMLVDRQIRGIADPRITALEGDLSDTAVLARIGAFRPDVVFHLAAVPGGAAEADYAAGRKVNLDAMVALFETLAEIPRIGGSAAPRVVYASTIAVYGTTLPDVVERTTPLHPPLTYGAHKLVGEILLADFTRRGLLDGRSVRLPGIVARPRAPSGLASAFMSDILHALKAGEPFTCPVSPQATAWWMSARRCAQNLLQAAAMDVTGSDPARAWPLPVLRLSLQEVVNTLARLYGDDRKDLVRYAPVPNVEAVFGRYPRLDDSASRALGLRDDGSPEAMVRRALDEPFAD
jgi:nucleoside-diphosphate-sugar epimerase